MAAADGAGWHDWQAPAHWRAIDFASDGDRIATGSYDGTARVWALPAGHPGA